MDYLKKFLHIERAIGQGAFGKVLVTSAIQNQVVVPQQQQQQQLSNYPAYDLIGSPIRKPEQFIQSTGNKPAASFEANGNNTTLEGTVVDNHGSTARFALKCIYPILKPQRLVNELRHLRDLGGKFNVVQMHTAHFSKGYLYIVMELIEHDRFTDFVAHLSLDEIVMYMKNLLVALNHVHAHQIIHRDIKPANFLYNRRDKKFLLVDFGLAQKVRFPGPGGHLTPNGTANVAMKRNAAELSSTSNMLKRLRVSSKEETREPVKLTVGAYESPVTTNDSGTHKRHMSYHKFSTPVIPSRNPNTTRCDCRGKPKTCPTCLARPDSSAPKSGTPGYKAPEILLRYPNQTQAIDIWSAGVILACLLSGHTPFFRDTDDYISLAEIITIFGSQRVTLAARDMGIRLNVEPKREPVDLKQLCKNIRQNNKDKRQIDIPGEAFDMLNRMLDPNPATRITAANALNHPWLSDSVDTLIY